MTPLPSRLLRLAGCLGALSAMLLPAAPASAAAGTTGAARAVVFAVDRVSFEDLLADPGMRALSVAGGAGLMSGRVTPSQLQTRLARAGGGGAAAAVIVRNLGSMERAGVSPADRLASASRRMASLLRGPEFTPGDVLVIVFTPAASGAMLHAKDELSGVIVARGAPGDLAHALRSGAPSSAPLRTLTSDSTRRTGVVTSDDLVATLVARLGGTTRGKVAGSPMRIVDALVPYDLHERYLAQRRMSVPVGIAAGLYVTVAGLFGIVVLRLRRRATRSLLLVTAGLAIAVVPLAIGLLEVGHLGSLTYGSVLSFLLLISILAAIAEVVAARAFGTGFALAMAGGIVLVTLAVESALGWSAALTPLLGGSELDGGRFYGMPNVEVGLLLGGAVFVGHRLAGVWAGTLVIFVAGLFAGLPWTGSNLGAAITLFVAAGLWSALRGDRSRPGIRALRAAAIVLAGIGIVLLAHRFLASTHITRFEEGTGLAPADLYRKLVDRLAVGIRLIERDPFALVPVLGVPATLAAVLRPPRSVRGSFERDPAWRDALLVILLGSVAAYVANDSGASAVGLGFGCAVGGMLFVSLCESAAMMGRT